MARKPRLDLANVPQHIVQRGHNRGPCFFEPHHRSGYLGLLHQAARAFEVALHAYALMTNHVHLLGTPRRVGAVSAMMQFVGQRYVLWINKQLNRTGTLFDGRFKSNLVDSERYLLCCYRYIEFNPVRAGMVDDPAAYPWSSYPCNAHGEPSALITPHPVFADLGDTPQRRQDAYRAFVAQGLPADEGELIRSHLRQGKALGSEAFQARVEELTGRPVRVAPRGRPWPKNK